MIERHSLGGTEYSIAEVDGVRYIFASSCPLSGKDLNEQTRDAIGMLQVVLEKEGACDSVVRQSVFLRHVEHVDDCRRLVAACYGDALPATTYIPQPPCNGKLIAVEVMAIVGADDRVQVERHSDHTVVARCDGVSWFHSSHVAPTVSVPHIYDRSVDCFQTLRGRLAEREVRFDQIVRMWLYLGDIVGPEGETQRYKELNRARTDFFRGIPFGEDHLPSDVEGPVYPASTGIGTEGKGIVLSSIALTTDRDDVVLLPLENPQQTTACDYHEHYSPQSPKFSRAMAVKTGRHATIFISGTASITESETRFVGDVEGQTCQTIDNIEALIAGDNFRQHGIPELGATLDDLTVVRVYVKRPGDYEKTKAVCRQRLGATPAIYVVGDVCRPDLLVEIEGIAFASPGNISGNGQHTYERRL